MPDPLCSDCPPSGYPTDSTRCALCPRRMEQFDSFDEPFFDSAVLSGGGE